MLSYRSRHRRTQLHLVATFIALGVTLGACGGSSAAPPEVGEPAPLSVVVLGDSIAAGEGINYGYIYSTGFPNEWTGGTDNPTWQGSYQLCHDSAQAYGDVLAPTIGASLTKFACTGSTYDNGIAFDRRAGGMLFRPAQFGNWLGMTNLNAAYDAAKPDVMIITLGANDVSFVDVVTFCATGYTDPDEVAAIAQLADPSQQLRANFVKKFPSASTSAIWSATRSTTSSPWRTL